jgi:hypothetical protein
VVVKDKPILSPLWILRPSRYASGRTFPFWAALLWWTIIQVLAWLEPVPPELDIQFHWKYLAFQHLCAIFAQFFLPLAFVPLLPKTLPGGRVLTLWRVSLGASFWYLWTFPLTFLFTGIKATVALELVQPLLWAGSLAWVVGGLRTSAGWRRCVLRIAGVLGLFIGSILVQLIPDSQAMSHFNMDNVSSGRICSGTPVLPAGIAAQADWTLVGNPQTVSAERLALGDRQRVLESRPGRVHVLVATGEPPPPEDTSGSLETASTDGAPLLDLVSRVPPGPDSLRLRVLHLLVHESIRYERTYFPGTPGEILSRGTGDCKAFAQVFCAGARHLGIPAKVVHGLLASADGYYAHAWVTVRTPTGWQDWDPTSSYPFPDARYLRFTVPREASSAFDGELAIFSLDSIRVSARAGIDLAP